MVVGRRDGWRSLDGGTARDVKMMMIMVMTRLLRGKSFFIYIL